MLVKKHALIGTALGLLALPIIASANLDTYNWTDQPSTVLITSSRIKICSGTFGKVTPPFDHAKGTPGYLSTSPAEIRAICGTSKGTCSADMYASANCTGTKVASLSINVETMVVNIDTSQPQDPHYQIDISSGPRVDVRSK